MLHYPCGHVTKHSSWRQLSRPLWKLRATPQRRKDKVHSWDHNYRVTGTAREGAWQVRSHAEKQLSILPPMSWGQRAFKHWPPLLQMHFFTHSINMSFHLLTAGCLPCIVQSWGSSFCPRGKKADHKRSKYIVSQMLGNAMKKSKYGERNEKCWKGRCFLNE